MTIDTAQVHAIRVVAAMLFATGCGDQTRGSASYELRDSAGIQIHEYSQPELANAPRWSVSAEPILDIGSGFEDDPRYEFFRIGSVERLGNGGLVVLNSGTREIRVYDAMGRHIRDIGRVGEGPGEFAEPHWFHVMEGDSILIFDVRQQRLTVFDPAGEPARTVSVGPLNIGYNPSVGILDDRSFLVRTEISEFRFPPAGGELRRDSLTYRRFTTSGEELAAFGTYPGQEMFWMHDGPGSMFADPLAFGRSFELVSGDSIIYLGPTDKFEIRAYTHNGQLRQILRVNADPVPVTSTMVTAFMDGLTVFRDSTMAASFRRLREAMPVPPTTPAFSRLAVDSDQNLWVRQYPLYPDSNQAWHIFDPLGRLFGSMELPARFEPKVLEATAITGIWRDDTEVEHLRTYEIERRE